MLDGYYGNPAIPEYIKWCETCQKYFKVDIGDNLITNEIGNLIFIPEDLQCPICDGYGE